MSVAPPPYASQPPSYAQGSRRNQPNAILHAPQLAASTGLPPTFRIGPRDVEPVVQIDELKAHLCVLACFNKLQADVRRGKLPGTIIQDGRDAHGLSDSADDQTVRWNIYCYNAAIEYDRWVTETLAERRTSGPLDKEEMPALAVMMCWHAHCLNPRRYSEDTQRVMWPLKALGGFPTELMASMIDVTNNYHSSTPTTGTSSHCMIRCPLCSKPYSVPLLTPPDAKCVGLSQTDFQMYCTDCHRYINHWHFQIAKFARDVETIVGNPASDATLAGLTLELASGRKDTVGVRLTNEIVRIFASRYRGTVANFGLSVAWKPAAIVDIIDAAVKSNLITRFPDLRRRLNRMHGAYLNPLSASLSISAAVQRQAGFIAKMAELGWLEPNRFIERPFLLQRSIARYHAFLDLMASSATSGMGQMLVPTLDIDLAWHTHQLKGETYCDDTWRVMNKVVDHDDKVEEGRLSDAYDITSKMWFHRFGVEYSDCGCHQTQSKLSKLKFFTKSSQENQRRAAQERMLVAVQADDADADATHPSVHNSVVVVTTQETALLRNRQSRQQRIKSRQLQQELAHQKAMKKAKSQAEKDTAQRMIERRRLHMGEDPFYYRGSSGAIPYWGVGMGIGVVAVGGVYAWGLAESADCQVMNGNDIPRGGCAVGGGATGSGACSTDGGGGGGACGSSNCAGGCGSSGDGGGGGGGGGGGDGGGGGGGGCGGGCGGGGS